MALRDQSCRIAEETSLRRRSIFCLGVSSLFIDIRMHFSCIISNATQYIKSLTTLLSLTTHSMDITSLVDTLADLFPYKARSELLERAASCDRIELVIEDLIQEQACTNDNGPSGLLQLQQVFPDASRERLERLLKENDSDVEKTVEAMMTQDASIEELKMVTSLLEDVIEPYLQKHSCRMLVLADLLCNHRRKKKVKGSRIQDSRNASSRFVIKELGYVFNGDSPETEELRREVENNPPLQQVNFAFLLKCLVFFEGEVDRVLRVAYLFVDHGVTDLTFNESLGLHVAFELDYKASDVLREAKACPPKTWKFTPAVTMSPNQVQRPVGKPQTPVLPVSSSKVDLHGLHVGEAVQAAELRVFQWWNEEVDARQSHGILSKFGSKALFVDPLDVIVGRGLHSAGGPKLGKAVKKMLDSNRFIYREEVGRVVVTGRHH